MTACPKSGLAVNSDRSQAYPPAVWLLRGNEAAERQFAHEARAEACIVPLPDHILASTVNLDVCNADDHGRHPAGGTAMTTEAQLKLAKYESDSDTLEFERRTSRRHQVGGHVTAVHSPAADGSASRICTLQLCDISDYGIGALVQEPVTPGTSITVFFPPHGAERGFDLYGHVVRCLRRGAMHEVGISLRTRAAA